MEEWGDLGKDSPSLVENVVSLPPHPVLSACHIDGCLHESCSKSSKLDSGSIRRALDLFSGTGSVAKALRNLGWEVTTLDIEPKAKADLQIDVLKWEFWKLPPGHFHLVAAGPPCQEYSKAKTVGHRYLSMADKIISKTIEIVQYFHPRLWWIENPRGGTAQVKRPLGPRGIR